MTAEAAVAPGAPPVTRLPLVALLAANAISLVGNRLTALAIPWFVLETTGSAARTGLVAFAGLFPTVLALLLGGALVDRLGFKRTSILADLASGLTVAAIPLLHATVGLAFWHLLVLTFLGALLDAPGGTARESLLPDLAATGRVPLERVNGASGTIQALAGLAGPPLAGLLVVALGPSNVLWLDAATFAASALLVAALVPAPAVEALASERAGYVAEVVTGLRFLRNDRLLLGIALIGTAVNFLAAPLFGVALPVFARDAFGTARDLGLMLAGFGLGSLAGSLLFGAVGPKLPRRPVLVGGFAVAGLSLLPLAATPPLPATVAALAVAGVGTGLINPIAGTVLQERIPPELRGRVLGAFMAGVLVAAPLGVLVAGGLIEAVGVRPLLLATGAILAAAALPIAVHPAFRGLDRPGSVAADGNAAEGRS
jgi:MFS family permease